MPKNSNISNKIYRLIDANFNRAKEGLRVCEDIVRFILNSYRLTSQIKKLRHQLQEVLNRLPANKFNLIKARDSLKDVGKYISVKEKERKDFADIFFANIHRTEESIRVLEEFTKLINNRTCDKLKYIRYDIYDIEKKVAKRFQALSHPRQRNRS